MSPTEYRHLVSLLLGVLIALTNIEPAVGQRMIGYPTSYNYQAQAFQIEQCMLKILDTIQECSERAVDAWNLNHSLYVPSSLSTCCANWEVFNCFMQAALEYCSLAEFQALAWNMTNDALQLQRGSCFHFKYRSEVCSGGVKLRSEVSVVLMMAAFMVLILFINGTH